MHRLRSDPDPFRCLQTFTDLQHRLSRAIPRPGSNGALSKSGESGMTWRKNALDEVLQPLPPILIFGTHTAQCNGSLEILRGRGQPSNKQLDSALAALRCGWNGPLWNGPLLKGRGLRRLEDYFKMDRIRARSQRPISTRPYFRHGPTWSERMAMRRELRSCWS